MNVIAIEGIDGLGKSTLIQGLIQKLGYYQVIHCGKPLKLEKYNGDTFLYQKESFINCMMLARSGAKIIFDRSWIGEFVYAPYRGYDGSYVFDIEQAWLQVGLDIRLILLTEDFSISRHFIDDGHSLGPVEKRQEEQKRFIEAFNMSSIHDKQMINVTDRDGNGAFRPSWSILAEALS